jgi:chromosome segregation ATPase
MQTHHELVQTISHIRSRTQKIKERVAELDQQIKSSSVDNVDKIEAELAEFKNSYYEIQARELLGEYDAKQKREIEERILAAEKRLKTETGALQNLVGIRQALEAELKNTQSQEEQCQVALEKVEFEMLKSDRQKLVDEIHGFTEQMKELFQRVASYNEASVSSATKILNREYQLKGFPNGMKGDGSSQEAVYQLAQPFDLNLVKNALAETLSKIASSTLSR